MANISEQQMRQAKGLPPNDGSVKTESAVAGGQIFLGESQREALDAIRRTLAERRGFVALTGAPGSGKTIVLSMVIAAQAGAAQPGPPCRIIKVDRADQVSAEQAAGIERLILRQSTSAGRQHTIIIVDDAHAAPLGLLRCLTRAAESCRLPGSSQVILVGRPDLWDRLKATEFAPLVECIGARPVLQPMTDEDVRGLIKYLLEQPRRVFGQALTGDAEQEVLRLAQGRPERVGAIVRSTLTLVDVQTRPPVSTRMISDVAAMLDGVRPAQGRKRRARVSKPALVAATALATAVGVAVAASSWPLDRLLPNAFNLARDTFPWRKPSVGDTAPKLAETARQSPVDRPLAADPPASVADALPAEAVQTAPVAPQRAVQDDASRIMAEAQPTAQPAPSVPAMSEMQEQPAAATAVSPALADQRLGANTAQGAPERPGPAALLQAPSKTGLAGPDTAASPSSLPWTAPTPLAPALVATLLRRGDEELALGDISTARRFYERTIAAGSAQGARGIARSFDPAILGRGNPAASSAVAASWYDMATTLDDVEAIARRVQTKRER